MSPRVLLVDDEPLVVRNVKAFLEDEGMEVDGVGSAEEALARVREGAAYDVCIMDLRLPGMDGSLAVNALHRLQPALRFIIHTGSTAYAVPDDLRALGIGELQLLRKPLADMELLADAVRTVTRR